MASRARCHRVWLNRRRRAVFVAKTEDLVIYTILCIYLRLRARSRPNRKVKVYALIADSEKKPYIVEMTRRAADGHLRTLRKALGAITSYIYIYTPSQHYGMDDCG